MSCFERIRYPDGQIGAKYTGHAGDVDNFLIKERINSYEDLFYIWAISEVINANPNELHGTSAYRLYIPCLFGQRSDRRFAQFQSFDLKLITDIINDCGFGQVTIFDPHSDISLALIENSRKETSYEQVVRAIKHYHDFNAAHYNYSEDPILVSPDAGAYKKVFEYGEALKLEVVAAVKHRDVAGKIDLKFIGDVKDKACFIIDDLCDGGYTFLTLADALRKQGAKEVYLYISHGLFSKGFGELHKLINRIYTTNSIRDIDTKDKDWIEVYPFLPDFLTQFKII